VLYGEIKSPASHRQSANCRSTARVWRAFA